MQMTAGEKGESSPRWSPDGRTVAFLGRRGESEDNQIFLISNAGGEARPLTKHATSVSGIAWTPDGAALSFLASDPKTDEEKEREKQKDDVFAYDENYKQQHLWKVAVADGADERLTSGDFSVLAYRLSRDGRKVVMHRAPDPLYGDAERGEVWVMDANGGNAVQLTKNAVGENGGELSPDGSQVLFVCAGEPAVRDLLQRQHVSRAGRRGLRAAELTARFPVRGHSPRRGRRTAARSIVAQHGRAQRAVRGGGRRPGSAARQLTDGQHAVTGGLVVRPRWTAGAAVRRADATRATSGR